MRAFHRNVLRQQKASRSPLADGRHVSCVDCTVQWHQGFFKREYTPTYRGFDTYFGSYTNNDHFTHIDPYGANPSKLCPGWTPAGNKTARAAGGCTVSQNQTCTSNHTRAPDGSCHTCVLYDLSNSSGSKIRNAPLSLNGTYSARLYGAEAARRIRQHAAPSAPPGLLSLQKPQPFFLYMAFTVVHSPNEAPAESIARYASTVPSPSRRLFGGMVHELDSAVGAIATALKQTAMWPDTLVVFSTDNGSPLSNGGNNAPLRGSKMTDWEGGTRGAAFLSGGIIPAGRRNGSWAGLMSQVDLYATLSSLAGVGPSVLEASGPVPPDSIDVWAAVISDAPSPRAELVYNINGNWSGGLRVGDFKLLKGDPNEAIRGVDNWSSSTPWKLGTDGKEHNNHTRCEGLACPCTARPCLFQVGGGVDPEERHDLADTYHSKVQEILARWDELQKTEVTLEASGLCPQSPGINAGGWPDASEPDGCAANREAGYWQPWM